MNYKLHKLHFQVVFEILFSITLDKKFSYRRETARQLRTSFSTGSTIVHFTEHRTGRFVAQLYKNGPTSQDIWETMLHNVNSNQV